MTDGKFLRMVGGRARQLRKARKLTQEDMTQFGFEVKYYQRIEYGKVNLTLKTVNRLANAFGVSVVDFLSFGKHSSSASVKVRAGNR